MTHDSSLSYLAGSKAQKYKRSQLANALVVLNSTAEDGKIEVRIILGTRGGCDASVTFSSPTTMEESEETNRVAAAFDKKRVKMDRSISLEPSNKRGFRFTRAVRSLKVEKIPFTAMRNKNNTTTPAIRNRWLSYHVKDASDISDVQMEDGTSAGFVNHGQSPPPFDDTVYFESFEDVSTSNELSVRICSDYIRQNLFEMMKTSAGNDQLLQKIEAGEVTGDNVGQVFARASQMEKNIALLWCAYLILKDVVEGLLNCGADLGFCEPSEGFSALHLSAFSGGLECCRLLIEKGASVNLRMKSYSPLHSAAFGNAPDVARLLIRCGAKSNLNSERHGNGDGLYGSPLHSAVKANAVECIQLLIDEGGCDVNERGPSGNSPLHCAADLGHEDCLKILLESGKADLNVRTRDKECTALHLAAEDGYINCVTLLLEKGAEADARNYRGQTSLHLAAKNQSLECVETLLKVGGCDVNAVDNDHRTPLHAVVCKTLFALDIIETLISWRADVNFRDKYGYTPLHVAALNELSQCVETLIYHGADVTAKSNNGTSALNIIRRKTPVALRMIYQKLDSSISMHDPEAGNREVELKLDFRVLLTHPKEGEICFLSTFVEEGQKEILEHPLCQAFLHLKWQKIRKYYLTRLILYGIFVMALTCYVWAALAHDCYMVAMNYTINNESIITQNCEHFIGSSFISNYPRTVEIIWYVLVFITICEIIRKLYGISGYTYIFIINYLYQVENIVEWFVIISVFLVSFVYTKQTYSWQNHVGAIAVLLGWTNLMVLIGQLPMLGSYVAMYTKVQWEFLKLLVAYACLLIGFTISFCVIFNHSKFFKDPLIGIIKVLVMMTGELDFGDFLLPKKPEENPLAVTAQITFVLFLLFVTVILMNLLVGIAVHDIQGLKKTAGLSKHVRQTKLIAYIELALFRSYLPKYFLNLLQWTALVSPSAYRVVLQVKPLNPREKRLPQSVLHRAYEVAKIRKKQVFTISSQGSNATTSTYLKSIASTWCSNKKTSVSAVGDSETITQLRKEIEDMKLMLDKNEETMQKLLSTNEASMQRLLDLNETTVQRLLEAVSKKCSEC
uniref:Ion transport domain-containing protein n=1 Tax=Timema cristinae TaxID=61476 RepID=A0A7R9CHQ6_TIMCR|nr:unnamed protein product [Timema cristinae]